MLTDLTVIITCHKYERFLPEAIDSILYQEIVPKIIVVDDLPSSHPTECEKVLKRYPSVQRIETTQGDPLKARKVGFDVCDTEYVCFLDADDRLGEGYIKEALQLLSSADIIYSDIQFFGNKATRTSFLANINPSQIALVNFMHVGCVAKRETLEISKAFNHPPLTDYHEDWLMWRKALAAGFTVKKQKGLYYARQHGHNKSTPLKKLSYYQIRGTAGDTIMFCDLNPRPREIHQSWPKEQTHWYNPTHRPKNKQDLIKSAIKTAWTDFIFFYDSRQNYRPDICEYLLQRMDSHAIVGHSTKHNFLECTIVMVPPVQDQVPTEKELRQLQIIYI
jgi:glycosyltransferase involved in cell wall biosynthesis